MVQDTLMTKILLHSKLNGGLYTFANTLHEVFTSLVANKTYSATVAAPKSKLDEAKLWHIRLGHIPFPNMKYATPYLDVSHLQKDYFCINLSTG